jgi:hypothetical protein
VSTEMVWFGRSVEAQLNQEVVHNCPGSGGGKDQVSTEMVGLGCSVEAQLHQKVVQHCPGSGSREDQVCTEIIYWESNK